MKVTAMDKANFHEPLAIMQPHMYWTDAQKESDIENYISAHLIIYLVSKLVIVTIDNRFIEM